MSYEVLSHTADVRLRVRGATLEELFRDALRGMVRLTKPVAASGTVAPLSITLDADGPTALLVDFLNEVLSRSQVVRASYEEVVFRNLTPTRLEAELQGIPVASFGEDVKAVTYHEAEVARDAAGGWEVTLVFDI